jgi:hypothetical protein
MKKSTLIICLLSATVFCKAQKHLPDSVTIKLSQRDLFAISQRVDSLQSIFAATSILPANQVTSFNQRLNIALSVIYNQVRAQMVADKAKQREINNLKTNNK